MKYIDADKLKQEIEKRFWAYGTPLYDDEVTTKADEILSFIDSLQQDQPEVDLEKEIDAYWRNWLSPEIDRINARKEE